MRISETLGTTRAQMDNCITAGVSVVWVDFEGHADVSGLDCCWGPCWGPRSCCSWEPYWYLCLMLPPKAKWMSVVCVTSWIHVGAHGPSSCRGTSWCERPVQSPEAMLMSLACAATKGYNGVHGPNYGRGPCWYLWSVLLPETMPTSLVTQWSVQYQDWVMSNWVVAQRNAMEIPKQPTLIPRQ